MWYALNLNKCCCINIQHADLLKMRRTERRNGVQCKTPMSKRTRLLLQTVQKQMGKGLERKKRRVLLKTSQGKKCKGTAHIGNSTNRKMCFLRGNKTNSKTPLVTERIWRPRQRQLNRSVQTLPRACTRNNDKNFVANCTGQQKGGLTFGIA